MGLLQGDQVTRFALPPPPDAAPQSAAPVATADPAVVASRPSAAPSPVSAGPIVLPAPHVPPVLDATAAPSEAATAAEEATAAAVRPALPDLGRKPGLKVEPASDADAIPFADEARLFGDGPAGEASGSAAASSSTALTGGDVGIGSTATTPAESAVNITAPVLPQQASATDGGQQRPEVVPSPAAAADSAARAAQGPAHATVTPFAAARPPAATSTFSERSTAGTAGASPEPGDAVAQSSEPSGAAETTVTSLGMNADSSTAGTRSSAAPPVARVASPLHVVPVSPEVATRPGRPAKLTEQLSPQLQKKPEQEAPDAANLVDYGPLGPLG